MSIFDDRGIRANEIRPGVRGRRGRWAGPVAEVLEGRQLLSTIIVNTSGDADGADGSGTLSLRQAIEISNGTLPIGSLSTAQAALVSGPPTMLNTIDFAIPGNGPFTIAPTSALPAIAGPTVIDGYSEPGARPNTDGPRQGKNTVLRIALDGTRAGAGATGLDLKGGASTVRGLAIGGFGVGLSIESGSGLVQGSFIGTDITGTRPLPNGKGIQGFVGIGFSNTIGGTAAGAGNVISGNTLDGLSVIEGDLIQGNFIGTDVTGTRALPNGEGNGFFSSEIATIGGTAAGAGNLISGNAGYGLAVQDLSVVLGNFIGTDVTGTGSLPNGGDGVFGGGGDDTIGGTAAGAGNVISGNGGNGVTLQLNGYLIQGNFIGTDATGTRAVPNRLDGIAGTTLPGIGSGQGNAIDGNLISGNLGNGVAVDGRNFIQGNHIGTDVTGSGSIPNGGDGVRVRVGSDNISANSIFSNEGLGIDLGGDGVTPNTPAGSPAGTGRFQNYPVLTSASSTGAGTLISATLDAAPSTTYRVEFFSSPVADPSGFGQGKDYLGFTLATTDTSGHASFSFTSVLGLLNQAISATATDPFNNTSEFARDIRVGFMTTAELVGPNRIATLGRPTAFAAVVGATSGGVPTGRANLLEDGVVIGSAPLDASGIAVFTTDSLAPGPHAITVAYVGDPAHAPSLSNAVAVEVFAPLAFGGPAVTSAGFAGPNAARITFNRGLLSGPGQDPANYAIVGPGHRPITIESAVYDPKTATVTLTTLQELDPRRSYQLTINGEQGDRIVHVFGIPLDGNRNGKPGHDFVGRIKKAPVVKTAHPSGPKPRAHATAHQKGH